MEEFKGKMEEINTLYNKATTETEYTEAVERAEDLETRMEEAGESKDEIAEAILNGFWAEYYLQRKFGKKPEDSKNLAEKVREYYMELKKPELKVAYGYLLEVIVVELLEDFKEAARMEVEIKEIVTETRNMVSILRTINALGIKEMKEGNFKGAVTTFNDMIRFEDDIAEDAFRHAGNILNNQGAAKIRGNIDPIGGARDLISAAIYYLRESEPPRKHLEGIRNRLREAKEKLT